MNCLMDFFVKETLVTLAAVRRGGQQNLRRSVTWLEVRRLHEMQSQCDSETWADGTIANIKLD